MTDTLRLAAFFGYLLSGIGFLFLFGLMITALRRRSHVVLLGLAALATVLWSLCFAWPAVVTRISPDMTFYAEFLRDLAWILFLSGVLRGAVAGGGASVIRYLGPAVPAAIIATGFVFSWQGRGSGAADILVLGKVISALVVLIYLEQIYRNARDTQRRGLKFLVVGVAIVFLYDLLLFSQAVLSGGLQPALQAARGYVVAMAAPPIALAVRRSPTWSGGLFVSRQIIFHTATVFAAGAYLTLGGVVGQYVGNYGGSWGDVGKVVFLVAVIVFLAALLISSRVRAQIRVFISKHFYENKYDYREEWLRLIRTLTAGEDELPLKKRAIKALADIYGAHQGVLWMKADDDEEFRTASSWNTAMVSQGLHENDNIVAFMLDTGWIVEVEEYRQDRGRYKNLEFAVDNLGLQRPEAVIPLLGGDALVGFVVLGKSDAGVRLNFEDRDLLKTVGRQIASHLLQERSTELLSQSKQFEAFNKLTAYLMHDLKNVLAQQSLIVENSVRHKSNPSFIEDAIDTIKSGAHRIRRVIEQLQQGSRRVIEERVELGEITVRAVSDCADRQPEPSVRLPDQRVWVVGDRDRLQMAIVHAIRNAQDACSTDGEVTANVTVTDKMCSVCIVDNGSGMSEQFIAERLFRPFDSTKGIQGMGIGAYQIRETVRTMGGTVDVVSEEGKGTSFCLNLDCAPAARQ